MYVNFCLLCSHYSSFLIMRHKLIVTFLTSILAIAFLAVSRIQIGDPARIEKTDSGMKINLELVRCQFAGRLM